VPNGSNPKYLANVKHAILAMVCAPESEAQSTIYALLQSNGWREPQIKNLKLLDQPFHTATTTSVLVGTLVSMAKREWRFTRIAM